MKRKLYMVPVLLMLGIFLMICPAYADDSMLGNQPKTVLVLAELCPAVSGAMDYGKRLALAGNDVTMHCFAGCHHGFLALLADRWQEAQEYIIKQLLTT